MRLTNDMRRDTVVAALESKFKKRRDAHRLALIAFGKAVYAHAYGDIAKLARKLPDGWVERSTSIFVEGPGFTWQPGVRKDQVHDQIPMGAVQPMPYRQHHCKLKISPNHPLYDQAQAIVDEHQAIRNERAELESQLNGIVASVTTVDALLKLWPQAKRFLPKIKPKSTAIVPVDLINAVNASLGIKD